MPCHTSARRGVGAWDYEGLCDTFAISATARAKISDSSAPWRRACHRLPRMLGHWWGTRTIRRVAGGQCGGEADVREKDRGREFTRLDAKRRGHRRARGQAMLEFALVAPLLFILIFGIIEYSLITFSIGTVNYATKDASRLGSLLGSSDPNVDTKMVTDIRNRTAGIAMAQVMKIEIFRANADGSIATIPGSSTLADNIYDINGLVTTAPWTPDLRQQTLLNADYIGVRVTYSYTYLTGFVGSGASGLTLQAVSIQRIEPLDFARATPRGLIARQSRTAPTAPAPGDALNTIAPQRTWAGRDEQGGAA